MSSRYVLLTAFSLIMATGQMLFKIAAETGKGKVMPYALINGWLMTALVLYAVATGLWVYILRSTPLSLAFTFSAMNFIIVPIGAWALFGEALSWRMFGGMALIVLGILLITR